jgi:hypothetical protein
MANQSKPTSSLDGVISDIHTDVGRDRLRSVLDAMPFPHFEATDDPGVYVLIESSGERTKGRFADKRFRKLELRP